MERSPACDALVRKWEGYHRKRPDGSCEAYPDPDPKGPVTIGFGTTKYNVVHRFGRKEVKLGDVLTREEAELELQWELDECEDALKTLIKAPVTQAMFDAMVSFAFNCGIGGSRLQIERINAGKYEEAAKSFDLYVNGASKKPLPGLVNRRNDEEALFRSQGLNPTIAHPKKVTWWEFYRTESGPVLVGYDGATAVVHITGTQVFDVISALEGALETAKTYTVAPPGKQIPILQAPTPPRPEPAPAKGGEARLVRTGAEHKGAWAGLQALELTIGDKTFSVSSGARGCQHFRRPQDPRSVPGNLEPLPQGRYRIADISWARGKDNYEGTHGAGLGPVWVALDAEFSDDRGAFGFHLDANIGGAPGSAGCVVFRDLTDLKEFVAALRKFDPKVLVVDWGISSAARTA
jgi:lysozyme